ncbi:MAG: hypothetical protein HQ594_06175 [Candidatus Omnitrophica bacterium]|nr:hypothetical protein [Candidatus Omnitrophota bacterium]
MWIKFDGKKCFVRLPEWSKDRMEEIVINKWVHVTITNGKLYIDGKENKPPNPKKEK